jgi:hypothetical protein
MLYLYPFTLSLSKGEHNGGLYSQKLSYHPIELLSICLMNIVFAVREDMQPRTGDALMEYLRVKTWYERVLVAMDNERRTTDQVQALVTDLASGLVQCLLRIAPARPQVL